MIAQEARVGIEDAPELPGQERRCFYQQYEWEKETAGLRGYQTVFDFDLEYVIN